MKIIKLQQENNVYYKGRMPVFKKNSVIKEDGYVKIPEKKYKRDCRLRDLCLGWITVDLIYLLYKSLK